MIEAPEIPRQAPKSLDRVEAYQRRKYLLICLVSCAALGAVFGLIDLKAGHSAEAFMELTAALAFGTLAGLVPKLPDLRLIFRLFAFSITGLLLFETAVGGAGGQVFLWILVMPAVYSGLFGESEGTLWSGGLATSTVAVSLMPGFHPYDPDHVMRFLVVLAAVVFMTHKLESARRSVQNELETETRELALTLAHARTLRGLLPLCSKCNKVRDDEGFWRDVDGYLREQAGTRLSHGLCPTCTQARFGDLLAEQEIAAL